MVVVAPGSLLSRWLADGSAAEDAGSAFVPVVGVAGGLLWRVEDGEKGEARVCVEGDGVGRGVGVGVGVGVGASGGAAAVLCCAVLCNAAVPGSSLLLSVLCAPGVAVPSRALARQVWHGTPWSGLG